MWVFLVFILSLLFFPLLGVGNDDCMPRRCRKDGPIIQFPFRLKHLHPEYCGYPGFDVFCDEKDKTALVLPFSVNVIVKKINYTSQQILLYDPEKCLPQKLLHLNLSASSFHFLDNYYLWNNGLSDYTLFNCSASERNFDYLIPCLGGFNYHVYAVESNYPMHRYPLISCTKIHKISAVPNYVFRQNNLRLKWSKPACGSCEAQGKRCSLSNYTGVQHIECMDKPKINQGASKKPLIAGATLGSFLVLTALVLVHIKIRTHNENQVKIEKFLDDYRALKPSRFSYSDIRRITHQFVEKLGEGGYGIVYKGKLSNEINVAVKVLNSSKGNGEEFVNEVSTIGRIHHVNVVRLVGFCAEGFTRALVYEFLPNDSLEKFIFQPEGFNRNSLGWERLKDIALGIAKGIEYLHEGCDQQILHFDIKPHNILLDQNFNPKICDFGLAKLCSKEQSAVTMTAARGTMGYIAPEVLSRTFGRVSYKSDVYSFGMMLLEMVGGRKNVDDEVNTSQVYFPKWIYNHLNLGEDIWAHIEEECVDGNIARKLSIVGLWCIQWYSTDRPSMKEVVQMLEGDTDNLSVPPNPFPATNSVAVAGIPERHYRTELPLILESE